MNWNWQQKKWPEFTYQPSLLRELEDRFFIESAKLIGASTIITQDEKKKFTIELMSE